MAAVVDGDLPRIRRGATSEEIARKRNSDEEVRPTPQMPTHLRTVNTAEDPVFFAEVPVSHFPTH